MTLVLPHFYPIDFSDTRLGYVLHQQQKIVKIFQKLGSAYALITISKNIFPSETELYYIIAK